MPGSDENTPAAARLAAPPRLLADGLATLSRLIALFALAVYAPALAGVALLITATSPGPILVKKGYQRRDGGLVYLYEFRTECWQTWRETPLGAFLRRADLHRLPRLTNVLTGEIGVGERVQRVNA